MEHQFKKYKIGNRLFDFSNAYVMGILNVTPDSFSDGGLYLKLDDAVSHALKMIDEGADIIDIGGESTRPGSDFVSEDEEINRIIPVLKKILDKKNDAIISIDTTKSKVAEESLKNGAQIINDISGLKFDENMVNVIKKYDASIIIMHIKGTPKNMQQNPHYNDVVKEVFEFLKDQSKRAKEAGVSKVIIDPGIGFGKRIQDNFELIKNLSEFKELNYPILIGLSRKSFLGKTLNLDINERDTSSAILEGIAIKNGARLIRTHNVKNGIQVCNLLNQIS